jgi:hypothetical protein
MPVCKFAWASVADVLARPTAERLETVSLPVL